MAGTDLCIRHTHLFPTDGSPERPDAVVLVSGGRIAAIADAAAAPPVPPGARVIDAAGTVCLPGLVNCHTHVAMTLLRGVGADLPLQRWLEEAIWPVEARLTDEDVLAGALLGCLEMLRGGTTAFADMYDHMGAVAEAVQRVGIRASLARGVIGTSPDWPRALAEAEELCRRFGGAAAAPLAASGGAPPPGPDHGAASPGTRPGPGHGAIAPASPPGADRAATAPGSGGAPPPPPDAPGREGGLITAMVAPHAEYTCPPEVWREALAVARRWRVPVHTHVSETAAEVEGCRARHGCSPVRYLHDLGVWEVGLLAAHCVHLDDEDVRLLADPRVAVSHNPVSNAKLGSGAAPLEALRAAGVRLGLGSDGAASTDVLSLWDELRAAAWLQKAVRRDAAAAPARELLRLATLGGAAALRLAPGSGRLQPGAPADLILVDVRGLHQTPWPDLAAGLVYGTRDADVALTVVAGRVAMERGEFPGVDHERVRADVRARCRRLLGGG